MKIIINDQRGFHLVSNKYVGTQTKFQIFYALNDFIRNNSIINTHFDFDSLPYP